MIRNLILLFASFYALKSFGKLDYDLRLASRSYPQGIAAQSDIGYGYKLWEKDKVMYGYLRPGLNFQASGVVNYAGAQLDFYPVSFIGISYGKTYGHRSFDEFQGFDCQSISCENSIEKNHLGVNIALSYKNIKLINLYKKQDFSNETPGQFFAEEYSNLVGFEDDELTTNVTLLGYQLTEKLLIGFFHMYNKMERTNQISRARLLMGNFTSGDFVYQAGIGAFENRNKVDHLSAIFILSWKGAKGLRLF